MAQEVNNNCGTQTAASMTNVNDTVSNMEQYLQAKNNLEDQQDYAFIQRIIQEITQSCALPLPLPASSIPPLIWQAASFFWENYDYAAIQKYYCLPNNKIRKCGPNNIFKLPEQILSVYGVYKTTDSFNYGALGDFSLERMVLNNSALASGIGGAMANYFGGGPGYNLTDVTGALYEVATYKAMFDAPLTYNYNPYSNELVILGALGTSDLILEVYQRCRVQDLYKLYYFFRYCVCLGMRALATIIGSYEFKMPGGVTINYQRFNDMANEEMQNIYEWVKENRSAGYFFVANTI